MPNYCYYNCAGEGIGFARQRMALFIYALQVGLWPGEDNLNSIARDALCLGYQLIGLYFAESLFTIWDEESSSANKGRYRVEYETEGQQCNLLHEFQGIWRSTMQRNSKETSDWRLGHMWSIDR